MTPFLSWIVFDVAPLHFLGLDMEPILPWFTTDPWEPMPLFMISAGGTALIVIISFVVCVEQFKDAIWLQPFVAAGQSTLSLYVAHIVIGEMGLKSLKFFNIDACLFPLWGGLLFFSTALLAASFWKKHFQKGPLEWMMRRLLEVHIPRLAAPFINGRFTHSGR